jgi:hypothetical protein
MVTLKEVPRVAASISKLKIDFASAEALPSIRSIFMEDLNALALRTNCAAARACNPKRFVTVISLTIKLSIEKQEIGYKAESNSSVLFQMAN